MRPKLDVPGNVKFVEIVAMVLNVVMRLLWIVEETVMITNHRVFIMMTKKEKTISKTMSKIYIQLSILF